MSKNIAKPSSLELLDALQKACASLHEINELLHVIRDTESETSNHCVGTLAEIGIKLTGRDAESLQQFVASARAAGVQP
jgi:hypothetical protein